MWAPYVAYEDPLATMGMEIGFAPENHHTCLGAFAKLRHTIDTNGIEVEPEDDQKAGTFPEIERHPGRRHRHHALLNCRQDKWLHTSFRRRASDPLTYMIATLWVTRIANNDPLICRGYSTKLMLRQISGNSRLPYASASPLPCTDKKKIYRGACRTNWTVYAIGMAGGYQEGGDETGRYMWTEHHSFQKSFIGCYYLEVHLYTLRPRNVANEGIFSILFPHNVVTSATMGQVDCPL